MRTICKLAVASTIVVATLSAATTNAHALPTDSDIYERTWDSTDTVWEAAMVPYGAGWSAFAEAFDFVWPSVEEHLAPVRDAQRVATGLSDQLLDAAFEASAPVWGPVTACLPPPFNGYRQCPVP